MVYGTFFNKKGQAEYISIEKVRDLMIDYEEFYLRRKAFETDPRIHASILLDDIEKMREGVHGIGLALPDHFKLSTKDLDDLEEECQKYIPS